MENRSLQFEVSSETGAAAYAGALPDENERFPGWLVEKKGYRRPLGLDE